MADALSHLPTRSPARKAQVPTQTVLLWSIVAVRGLSTASAKVWEEAAAAAAAGARVGAGAGAVVGWGFEQSGMKRARSVSGIDRGSERAAKADATRARKRASVVLLGHRCRQSAGRQAVRHPCDNCLRGNPIVVVTTTVPLGLRTHGNIKKYTWRHAHAGRILYYPYKLLAISGRSAQHGGG